MDLFERLRHRQRSVGQNADAFFPGYLTFPKLTGEVAPRMTFNGRERLVWCLNNYLGLANHPTVRRADAEAAARYGLAAPMGSRAMSGEAEETEQLEAELATTVRKPAAMLLNYGYQGMFSLIDALVDSDDVIVFDAEVHACAVDGVRLHTGKRFAYAHNDIASLAAKLEEAHRIIRRTGGGILVITEGVFSMAGDLGKLRDMVALKQRYDFKLLVDDAHGFGVLGREGAGSPDHLGVQEHIDMYFATFAKAMASIGAFIAGPKDVVDVLRHALRVQIFSKTLPLPIVASARTRLDLLRKADAERRQVWTVTNALHAKLRRAGFDIGKSETPVTPVYFLGQPLETLQFVRDIREDYDIFSSVVTYPVIAQGTFMLRLIATALHTVEDVDYTVDAFTKVRQDQVVRLQGVA